MHAHPRPFRHREWRRICERAGIGKRALKDLRDTYACWLLAAGVQLGYVSQQLGHSDVELTARHYARWMGGAEYREPMELERGEVPADLLSRLSNSPQSPPSEETAGGAASLTAGHFYGSWRAQHDSNVRPPGPQPDALSN